MNKHIIIPSLLVITSIMAFTTANAAERKKGPPRGKPPTEAFQACANKSAGDSCSFTGSRGDASGSCLAPPNGDEVLACAPKGGRPTE